MNYKKYLKESTVVGAYADTGPKALAGDDDYPTGNILIGTKYKRTGYYNRLTNFGINWVPDDSDWTWADFEGTGGQDSIDSYSDTLKDKKDSDRIFKRMTKVEPKPIPKHLRPLGNDLGPYTDAWGNPADADDYERTADMDGEDDAEREERKKQGKPYRPRVMKDVIKKINGLI